MTEENKNLGEKVVSNETESGIEEEFAGVVCLDDGRKPTDPYDDDANMIDPSADYGEDSWRENDDSIASYLFEDTSDPAM